MNLNAISHRSVAPDCYGLNREEVVIRIRTGKDVTAVNLIHGDPYAFGISGVFRWSGESAPMQVAHELKHCLIWSATIRPKYKRVQYYFEIVSGDQRLLMLEDDFYDEKALY